MKKIITLFLLLIIIITSCTIEKRQYNPGFFITLNNVRDKNVLSTELQTIPQKNQTVSNEMTSSYSTSNFACRSLNIKNDSATGKNSKTHCNKTDIKMTYNKISSKLKILENRYVPISFKITRPSSLKEYYKIEKNNRSGDLFWVVFVGSLILSIILAIALKKWWIVLIGFLISGIMSLVVIFTFTGVNG